jgi:hypothetical protein
METCGGKDVEQVDYQHEEANAVDAHLASFLGYNYAATLIDEHGVDRINAALRYYAGNNRNVTNPSGFFRRVVSEIAAGRITAPPVQASQQDDRARFARDYHRLDHARKQVMGGDVLIARIKKLRAQGLSLVDIAAETQVGIGNVRAVTSC